MLMNAKLVTMTNGSYKCTCANGFMGNGMSCVDVNECTNGAAKCGKNARCLNTRGDYDCECLPGYKGRV